MYEALPKYTKIFLDLEFFLLLIRYIENLRFFNFEAEK